MTQETESKEEKLELKNKTFLDAFIDYSNVQSFHQENVILYNLLNSGLLQLINAKKVNNDNTYNLIPFKVTAEIERKANIALNQRVKSEEDKKCIYDYNNLKNITYLSELGKLSIFNHVNDLRWINASGYYRKENTLQGIIVSYLKLTDDEKKEIEDVRKLNNNKNLHNRDVLYKLLIKIQRAVHYIYPIRKENDGTITRLGDLEMLPPVSALLTLTYNTLKKINPLNAYEK